ncbi:hypothetical protein G5B39_10325 [Rhodobacteraceae bacterium SC52]|nr:hypothetical protein G5B39_10325 [Rhodobacteraceae bacterium SC52]
MMARFGSPQNLVRAFRRFMGLTIGQSAHSKWRRS